MKTYQSTINLIRWSLDKHYLKDLEQNLSNGYSPADLLTSKYNGEWKKNIKKIYEEEIF